MLPSGVQKIGLEAVLSDANFQKGLSNFLKGIDNMVRITETSSNKINASWDSSIGRWRDNVSGRFVSAANIAASATKDMAIEMVAGSETAAAATTATATGFSILTTAVTATTAVIGGALTLGLGAAAAAFAGLTLAIKGTVSVTETLLGMNDTFLAQSINTTARVNEMALVTDLLGTRAGFSSEEIRAQTGAIKDMGITTSVALGLQAKFAQYELDMAKATDLARVAQDSAVLSMQDSSTALDELIYAVTTGNNSLNAARVLGVNFTAAQEEMAKALGITREQLTKSEQTQANLNAVIAAGANIAGVYEQAMDAPAKQLRSWNRDVENLKEALGQPFQTAFGTLVAMLRDTTKWLTRAISEGGVFHNTLIGLGSVASLFADGLSSLVKAATNIIDEVFGELSTGFGDMATDALTWGVNVAVQFADGIIKGITAALTAAMNFINSLLSGWLAPGSPPKVAPDLIKWGMGAMMEYLKGFTQADYGVLNAIQGPLEDAFSVLVDMGKVGKNAANARILEISKMLGKSLSFDEALSEGLFEKISKSAGKFGPQIAELAKLQYTLADATKAEEAAEIALAKAQEKQARASGQVAAETRKYNKMLREGASKDALATQMASIKAAEQASDLASTQLSDAQKEIYAQKDLMAITEEKLANQQALIDQMLKLSRLSIKEAKDTEEEDKKKKKEKTPKVPDTGGDGGGTRPPTEEDLPKYIGGAVPEAFPDIGQMIADKITEGKQKILDAFGEIFSSVSEKIDAEWGPALETMSKLWGETTDNISQFYDEKVKPKFEALGNWLTNTLPAAWENFKTNGVQPVVDWMNQEGGLIDVLNQISGEDGILANMADIIETVVTRAWKESLYPALVDVNTELETMFTNWATNLQDFIENKFYPFFNDFVVPILNEFADITLGAINSGLMWINSKLGSFNRWLETIKVTLGEFVIPEWLVGHSPPPLANSLAYINDEMSRLAKNTMPKFSQQMGMLNMQQPAFASMPIVGGPTNNTMNFNMTNHVSDRMDAAMIVDVVDQRIKRMFG